jgi:hypothetical protein
MEKSCGVYFRGEDVYVITSSYTTIGLLIATEPMFRLKRTDSPTDLGATVMEALQASRKGVPNPEDLRSVGIALAGFFGVKTLSSFERTATYFSLSLTANGVNIMPTVRGNRGGFSHLPDQAVNCKAEPTQIGETLLRLAAEQ